MAGRAEELRHDLPCRHPIRCRVIASLAVNTHRPLGLNSTSVTGLTGKMLSDSPEFTDHVVTVPCSSIDAILDPSASIAGSIGWDTR